MKKLVIYGNPDYQNSFANKRILEELVKKDPSVEIRNLAKLYPDWKIDVKTEQEKLVEADTIVFEFPFWWYSSPSILHRYIEEVFTYGFAYGSNGKAVEGKRLIVSFTTGGSEEEYSKEGSQEFEIDAYLPQFKSMAKLTGMKIDFLISFDMSVAGADEEKKKQIEEKALEHGRKLAESISK